MLHNKKTGQDVSLFKGASTLIVDRGRSALVGSKGERGKNTRSRFLSKGILDKVLLGWILRGWGRDANEHISWEAAKWKEQSLLREQVVFRWSKVVEEKVEGHGHG